jgi:hypothetical protein
MVRVLEDASAVTADIAVDKMHACAARKAVETVVMEAAIAALHAMHNDPPIVSLEAVAMEAAKVIVRELHVASSRTKPRSRRRCTAMTPRTRSRASPQRPWWPPG